MSGWRLERSWREYAACGPDTAHLFIPVSIRGGLPERGAAAKRICATCLPEVRQACLDFALSLPSVPIGIWAGMSTSELRRERRRRQEIGQPQSLELNYG